MIFAAAGFANYSSVDCGIVDSNYPPFDFLEGINTE